MCADLLVDPVTSLRRGCLRGLLGRTSHSPIVISSSVSRALKGKSTMDTSEAAVGSNCGRPLSHAMF